ncbi:enoyl-CoA hydratase-related protein [Desulfosarcina cetonica]|uniref:enoyl-CoA hydratase-related protein n=1 Tax=Desulfosarcina cetonica TaxID=90730 RepID=UPI00248C8E13|nr:enoyl-CoA hydratase-related protein [Desulfosarcina cetonica]
MAAINGYAMGGGLELALACHFRLLADNPKIKLGLTELNLGIIPGWGGTQRLPRLVGRTKALEMILLSQTLDARAAFDCGLVDRLVPPAHLLDDAMTMAQQLAERPPVAVRYVLEAFSTGIYEGLDQGLLSEAEGAAIVRQTEDREEGFAAFKEKRKPQFSGK